MRDQLVPIASSDCCSSLPSPSINVTIGMHAQAASMARWKEEAERKRKHFDNISADHRRKERDEVAKLRAKYIHEKVKKVEQHKNKEMHRVPTALVQSRPGTSRLPPGWPTNQQAGNMMAMDNCNIQQRQMYSSYTQFTPNHSLQAPTGSSYSTYVATNNTTQNTPAMPNYNDYGFMQAQQQMSNYVMPMTSNSVYDEGIGEQYNWNFAIDRYELNQNGIHSSSELEKLAADDIDRLLDNSSRPIGQYLNGHQYRQLAPSCQHIKTEIPFEQQLPPSHQQRVKLPISKSASNSQFDQLNL